MDYNETEDWEQFRSMHTLSTPAGVGKGRIGALVAKEVVDNGLDSGGRCRIGYLEGGFFVEDDGTGIDGTDEEIASLFSMRRPLRTTKMWRMPKRGALGNGLRVLAGAVCATQGFLSVSTRGRRLCLMPQYEDGSTKYKNLGPWDGKGTRVEVILPGLVYENMLSWAKETIAMSSGKDYEGHSSPWWYCSESFRALVHSLPDGWTLNDFLRKFGVEGDRKAAEVAFRFSNKKPKRFTETECDELLFELRRLQKPVKSKVLLEYGSAFRGNGRAYREGSGSYVIKPVRGRHEAQIPFGVQAWGNKCGREDNPSVRFFVNKTRITGKVSMTACGLETSKGTREEKYFCIEGCGLVEDDVVKISKLNFPMDLIINIVTPHMQITSSGKEPDFSYMRDVMNDIIKQVAKDVKKNTKADRNAGGDSSIVECVYEEIDELIGKVSDNLSHRYNPRHLFYPMRDIVNERLGKTLTWKYFERILTDIENEDQSDLPGIYRDLRGTLYHPHLKEDIPLGTLNVEKYKRPDWTFNKILYIEKEGFFEILKDLKWPERNDCALLSSKGFATRAVRDVIDLIGKTDEEIQFFCVHDADAYGTLIYQCLVETTKARPARKVKVHNIGLEPWEALLMRLSIEDAERISGRKPVAEYIKKIGSNDGYGENIDLEVWNRWLAFLEEKRRSLNGAQWKEWLSEIGVEFDGGKIDWEKWLQINRIELNAISIKNFVAWLDEKMERYGPGKVLPPEKVIRTEMREKAKEQLSGRIRQELNRKFDIDKLVSRELSMKLSVAEKEIRSIDLRGNISKALESEVAQTWKNVASQIVTEITKKID